MSKGWHAIDWDGFSRALQRQFEHPKRYTLSQAAELIGVSKPTIFRAIHKQAIAVENFLALCLWLDTDPYVFLVNVRAANVSNGLVVSPEVSRGVSALAGSRGSLPEFACWKAMLSRCYYTSCSSYGYYGGRGIQVCDRWHFGDGRFRDGFDCFLSDMGARPTRDHSLDRFPNPDGNYQPDNCRWATAKEQNRNTRANLMVEYRGCRVAASEAAEMAGGIVSGQLAAVRIARGWRVDEAVETPPRTRGRGGAAS